MSILAVSPLSGHGAHTVTLLGPAALITLLALAADARARFRKPGHQPPPPVMLAAVAWSVSTAAIHATQASMRTHRELRTWLDRNRALVTPPASKPSVTHTSELVAALVPWIAQEAVTVP